VLVLLGGANTYGAPAEQAAPPSPAPGAGAPEAAAPSARFDVHEYRVLGNSVLSNREIEGILYPLLGDQKTIDDVQTARGALEKVYHDHGYATVFVDIPEQEVADKIVRLHVTEGRLHSVTITGARYFSERKIVAALPAATPGKVPSFTALQNQLNAVNARTPDLAVTPVLKAGPTPGTADMSLKVSDKLPLHGSIELNNQYSPDTRPLRVLASLSYNDLFQAFDTLAAQYQISPQDTTEVKVLAVNYAWGASPSALHPSIYFIDSKSNVPTVGTIGVLGAGQIYGARFSFPLGDKLIPTESLTLGLDYKDFQQTIGLAGSSAVQTPISYLNLSLGYAGSWSARLFDSSFESTANFGPRGALNDPEEFANKRFQARPNYFYLKVDGSMLMHLAGGVQLLLRADGQWAEEPLVNYESFVASGADGVRGYLEAEVLADRGLKGSAQLQSPVAKWRTLPLGDLFVFYDAAFTEVINPLPDETARTHIRSWGAGLHLLPGKAITGSLTWAEPLLDGPTTRRGESRILFFVRGVF
jgi:hemolysin activation/secretion protein